MLKSSINKLRLIFFAFLLSNCVSVGVQTPEIKKATNVQFEPPPPPYKLFEQENLDRAWRNPNNGNTISYLSECDSPADPNHEQIREGIVAGVQKVKILSEAMIDFNQRRALRSHLSGVVDGIETEFEVVILKKNNCIYILTYVGMDRHFLPDIEIFRRFVKGFRAP